MRISIKPMVLSAAILSLPLLTGCGKDNPMAPEVEQPKQYEDVTVTLVKLFAVEDGDGIEGNGDFTYSADVYDGSHFKAEGSADIGTGGSFALNRTKVYRIEKGQDYRIKVSFKATEWDQNILGQVYADSRMDNLIESRLHVNGQSTDGFSDGERWITLGTGDLQLRLVYRITKAPVS